ncbi:MAG: hypothetical protein ACYCX2_01355 [Christensenellales bacterium]
MTISREACDVKAKVIEAALTLFLAAILIYFGVQYLIKVWWALVIIGAVVMVIVIIIQVRRSRSRW